MRIPPGLSMTKVACPMKVRPTCPTPSAAGWMNGRVEETRPVQGAWRSSACERVEATAPDAGQQHRGEPDHPWPPSARRHPIIVPGFPPHGSCAAGATGGRAPPNVGSGRLGQLHHHAVAEIGQRRGQLLLEAEVLAATRRHAHDDPGRTPATVEIRGSVIFCSARNGASLRLILSSSIEAIEALLKVQETAKLKGSPACCTAQRACRTAARREPPPSTHGCVARARRPPRRTLRDKLGLHGTHDRH